MTQGSLIILVVGFALVWIVFIRPQKRRQLAQRQLLEDVSPGTEILTAGGVYGTVRGVDEDEITVEIAPGTNIRLARRAIAAVIPPEEPEELEEAPAAAGHRSSGEGPS